MKRSYRYAPEVNFFSPAGEHTAKEYKTVLVNGAEQIECVGSIPLHELIQADGDSCRISNIVRRFTAGDAAALNARSGQYLDLTAAPQNLLEAHQRLKDAESYFGRLPADVQRSYDFDFNKFISAVSDGSFVTDHGVAAGILQETNASAAASPAASESVM